VSGNTTSAQPAISLGIVSDHHQQVELLDRLDRLGGASAAPASGGREDEPALDR